MSRAVLSRYKDFVYAQALSYTKVCLILTTLPTFLALQSIHSFSLRAPDSNAVTQQTDLSLKNSQQQLLYSSELYSWRKHIPENAKDPNFSKFFTSIST